MPDWSHGPESVDQVTLPDLMKLSPELHLQYYQK